MTPGGGWYIVRVFAHLTRKVCALMWLKENTESKLGKKAIALTGFKHQHFGSNLQILREVSRFPLKN